MSMMHQGEEMTPEEEHKYKQVYNWVKSELAREGYPADTVDVDAYFQKDASTSENYQIMAREMRKAKPRPQMGSRNYQRQEMEKQEESARLAAEKARFEEAKNTPHKSEYNSLPGEDDYSKEGGYQRKEVKGNIPRQGYPKEVVLEETGPSIVDRVLSGVGEAKSKYIDEPAARNLKEREYKAQKNIEARTSRLNVNALEREEKALAKREFNESVAGRIIKGVQSVGRQNEQQYRGKYTEPYQSHSPMQAAMHGQQEQPVWLRASQSNEQPGVMKQITGNQRSALFDATSGRYQRSGYSGGNSGYQGERAPRRKVITVNGRTYIVQGEQNREYNQAPPTPALFQAMTSNPSAQRGAQHISPLMAQAFNGNQHESKSAMMSALLSGPSRPQGKEKQSQFLNAMQSGAKFNFSKRKGGFKF
jgi:hypothetical protein